MQQGYSIDGQSAGMNGTAFTLDGNAALGGVRVTSPVSHSDITGAHGVTFLTYTIGLEADFMIAQPLDVLSFSESISFTDNAGGPIFVERIPAVGEPILQQVATQSWYYATQSGKGSLAGTWLLPATPVFSTAFLRTSGNAGRTVTYSSPKMIRGIPAEFETQWKYEFISATPLIGFPSLIG